MTMIKGLSIKMLYGLVLASAIALAALSFEPAEYNGAASGDALDWTSMMANSVRNHPDMGKGTQ